jgi:hypothetical protein
LEAWGYESGGAWEFDPQPLLNPAEGSEYMHGLFHHENGPHASWAQRWVRTKRSVKSFFGR